MRTPWPRCAPVSKTRASLAARAVRVLRSGDKTAWLEVVLDEGRNRHIRRLLAAFDLQVLRLVRVAIGGLVLGDLGKGQWRVLQVSDQQRLGPLHRADHRPWPAVATAVPGVGAPGCRHSRTEPAMYHLTLNQTLRCAGLLLPMVLLAACGGHKKVAKAETPAETPVVEVKTPELDGRGSYRFLMSNGDKKMTADEFDAWMKANGIRVARAMARTLPPSR